MEKNNIDTLIDEIVEEISYKTIIETKVRGYVEAVNLVDRVLLEVPKSNQKTFKIIIKECDCK
jgi:hypothetical protein